MPKKLQISQKWICISFLQFLFICLPFVLQGIHMQLPEHHWPDEDKWNLYPSKPDTKLRVRILTYCLTGHAVWTPSVQLQYLESLQVETKSRHYLFSKKHISKFIFNEVKDYHLIWKTKKVEKNPPSPLLTLFTPS